MADRKYTQVELLLALLRERGQAGVTPLMALDRIGSFRLAARINDLRKAGHAIRSERISTTGGASVAKYTLAAAAKPPPVAPLDDDRERSPIAEGQVEIPWTA